MGYRDYEATLAKVHEVDDAEYLPAFRARLRIIRDRARVPAPRMLMVTAAREKDLLWTLEEAVASGAFGAVVGSLGPRERLYGFSASRRPKLRAAASRIPLFLRRHRSNGGATAAQGLRDRVTICGAQINVGSCYQEDYPENRQLFCG